MNLSFLDFLNELSNEKIKEIEMLPFIDKGRANFEIGDKYNRLTILGRAKGSEKYNNTYVYAICNCKDHNIIKAQLNKIKKGNTQSCGCYHKECATKLGQSAALNLLGEIIGDFKIIKKTDERDSEAVVWLGECIHCGKIRKISTRYIHDLINHPHVCTCQRRNGSAFERKVDEILTNNNITFEREVTFDELKYEETNQHPRYDFLLPQYNCIIELHGEQHYKEGRGFFKQKLSLEDTKARDAIKQSWAIQNGYKYIVIPYTQQNNITINDLLPDTSYFLIKEDM